MKISVLGSGGWGTALAILSYNCSHKTVLWGKFEEEVKTIKTTLENPLLKGVEIPESINVTSEIKKIKNSDIVIIATPSFAVEETAQMIGKYIDNKTIVVSVAKGFEKDTLKRFSQVIKDELPNNPVVVLSGPSHAEEVGRKIPTSIVAASEDLDAATAVQEALSNKYFRIYTNTDVVGVEVGAALKNVIAVAAGVITGMKLGDNTTAALMTRGLAEMATLGEALGGNRATFAGLSGIGDLVVTCTSEHSRNRAFGKLVGKGISVEEAKRAVGTVEGYFATKAAKLLADKHGVEMPIVSECYNILYKGNNAKDSLISLMTRDKKQENL